MPTEFDERLRFRNNIDAVFAFMSDPGNLSAGMPPWLRLQVCTAQPIAMAVGTRIEYRLRIYGVPVAWHSEFTVWEPPKRFAYEQRRGPFRTWTHEHTFTEDGGVTTMLDHVVYTVPFGRVVDDLIVSPLLERLFRWRARQLGASLGTVE